MHKIEHKIEAFLLNKTTDKNRLDVLGHEFADKVCPELINRFTKSSPEPFRLRMSNIGLSLRQLCLQRDYGKPVIDSKFSLSGFYGIMLEAFTMFLLDASGVEVSSKNEKVELNVEGFKLQGELDCIIDGAVWDIKSASNWSYNNKFVDWQTLQKDDPFGYINQGFCYAMAKSLPFGGWIVINKEKGLLKVVSIPQVASVQRPLQKTVLDDVSTKIIHVTEGFPAPVCDGVEDEYFRRVKTGNRVLNRTCEWCNHKEKCHKGIQALPSILSEARDKPIKYYVKVDKKYDILNKDKVTG